MPCSHTIDHKLHNVTISNDRLTLLNRNRSLCAVSKPSTHEFTKAHQQSVIKTLAFFGESVPKKPKRGLLANTVMVIVFREYTLLNIHYFEEAEQSMANIRSTYWISSTIIKIRKCSFTKNPHKCSHYVEIK